MKHALVVDDQDANLEYLRVILQATGWTVETARHGAEALAKARHAPPDLVVSDLLMPVMDGYTLLRHWKADARLRRIPFVVYTATYTQPEDEELALSLGADAFILKPSEPDEFLARIQRVTAAAVAAPPAAPAPDDAAQLQLYSTTLVRKLEEKMLQLEQSNEHLRRNEALLRVAGRAARLGGWTMDVAARTLVWSDEVCAMHEVPAGTVPSLAEAVAFYRPDDRAVVRSKLEACASAGTPFDLEAELVTRAGRHVWVRCIGAAERTADGVIARIQGALQDVDETHRLQEQFQQSQKMEAVGRLAGGIAHDFNNILSVILSYADFVLEDLKPGDPIRPDLLEIRRAGERATELTRQLLTFSRQQVVRPRVLDLGQTLGGMERMLRRLLGEDVELALPAVGAIGKVFADPSQVEQIVMNLAVNARDAMPRGGKLTIELRDIDVDAARAADHHGLAEGPYVMLTVTDTGVGMSPATRERIFEPFFTTKDKGKGTGLGLSIVFGIVKQSHGYVSVESELGHGATFHVYLPRTERVDVDPASASASAVRRGTETILLVEDDEQVRTMTRKILQRHGYTVLEAANGGEAFLISEQPATRIDLLVTDVVMPRMSGRELAERLAKLRPGLRVLYLSGYTEDAIIHHGVRAADIAFLQKPVSQDILLRAVRGLLDAAA